MYTENLVTITLINYFQLCKGAASENESAELDRIRATETQEIALLQQQILKIISSYPTELWSQIPLKIGHLVTSLKGLEKVSCQITEAVRIAIDSTRHSTTEEQNIAIIVDPDGSAYTVEYIDWQGRILTQVGVNTYTRLQRGEHIVQNENLVTAKVPGTEPGTGITVSVNTIQQDEIVKAYTAFSITDVSETSECH